MILAEIIDLDRMPEGAENSGQAETVTWPGGNVDRDARIPSIVAYLDVIGMKQQLNNHKPGAVGVMRALEDAAYAFASNEPHWYDGMYVWNDSVLTVSHLAEDNVERTETALMRRLQSFKDHLENSLVGQPLTRLYCICIKGEAFLPRPDAIRPLIPSDQPHQSKYVYVRASSLALANVFEVDMKLGQHHAEWYVDDRIHRHLPPTAQQVLANRQQLPLFADRNGRSIHMGNGRLFEQENL